MHVCISFAIDDKNINIYIYKFVKIHNEDGKPKSKNMRNDLKGY